MEWYVLVDGVRRGPMSKASVLRLMEMGVIKPNMLARKAGMSDWLPIGLLREFEPGYGAPPQAAAPPLAAEPSSFSPLIAPEQHAEPEESEPQQSIWHYLRRYW